MNFDQEYRQLLYRLINEPEVIDPKREGITRKKLAYYSMCINVENEIPLTTCKKSFLASAVKEFNFFINNDTNISNLKAGFWNDDAYNFYLRLSEIWNVKKVKTLEEFLEVLGEESQDIRAYRYGDIGPVYGALWKDQVNYVIDQLNNCIHHTDMLVISSDYRNKNDIYERALEACHYSWQVVSERDEGISIVFNMRSSDVFLGLPMNVAFYYTIGKYLEEQTGHRLINIYASLSNPHLYSNTFRTVEGILDKESEDIYVKDCISFTEVNGRIQAVLENTLDLQIYNQTIEHLRVPMLSQSNNLL